MDLSVRKCSEFPGTERAILKRREKKLISLVRQEARLTTVRGAFPTGL